MNIGTVSDFDNYLVFGDAIRQAVWIPGPDTNSQFRKSFNKDESSCPQIPGSQGLVYLRGSAGDQYTLRIRSTANYANPGTASVTILGQTYTADAIITLAADTVSAGMVINSSDNTLSTWNTVVELWHPGQVGNKFHTDYIAPLLDTDGNGGNTGIIRFLNWLPINRQRGNQQPVIVTPDDMIEPDRPCQANTQFRSSPELMFEFADACNADVWFNIPHTANDALIAHLAGLALAWKTANPQKRVYVEFSNEMWNTGTFGQAIDARDWGKIEWPQIAGETPSQWNVRAMASWYGKYAARAFNVFDQTYTGQPYELVLAWQAASNSTPVFVYDEFILERDGNVPPDCWAIAPYSDIRIPTQKTFVNAYEQQVVPGAVDQDDVIMAGQTAAVDALLAADWTPATMLNLMNTATNDGIAQSTKYIQNHFAFASPRGMRLVCYEGGEHLLPRIQYAEYELSGFPRAVTYPQFCDNFVATSYLAGMQDHLEALDAVWVAEGGQECVWLVYVQEPRDDSHASFGFRRDMYDDLSPKWRAWQTIVEDDILRAAGLWGT